MSALQMFKLILKLNPINFILNMIAEIFEDNSYERKMHRLEKYLNIDLNDILNGLWKSEKYIDHDWYLTKGGEDFLYAVLNRNYIKEIKLPQKKVRSGGFTIWYMKLSYQDRTKDTLYARHNPQGLTDIYNWFQDYESFVTSHAKSRLK